MESLTAIILTKNEEKNIAECLKSIQGFASRAVVVDCGSTDGTVEIAQSMGAEVLTHEFSYYAAQFNWGIDHANITTDWILRLDADERLTPESREQASAVMRSPEAKSGEVTGVTIESLYYFMDRPMRHGIRNKRKILIFRTGIGRIEDRRRDAHSILASGRSEPIRAHFLHYDYKDLYSYIRRYNWYATRELMDYIDFTQGKSQEVRTDKKLLKHRKKKFGVYYRAPRFIRCWLWFVYNFVFRGGFLDGREGFLYHYFECMWYRMLVDARIFEYEKTGKGLEALKALE